MDNRRKQVTNSRWNRALSLCQSRKERFPFWTVVMRTVGLTTSCGTNNILVKALHSWWPYVQLWMKWRMEDSQFSLIRVPNSSHCTSQLPSLETQPPTSVQQVHSAPQAPAACTQTCSRGSRHTLLCRWNTHTICLCIKVLIYLRLLKLYRIYSFIKMELIQKITC